MIGNGSLQYVDDTRPVLMVVNGAEHASWLYSDHSHAELAPGHTLNFRAKVDGSKQLHRYAFRLLRRGSGSK